jgi:hypothetical protein
MKPGKSRAAPVADGVLLGELDALDVAALIMLAGILAGAGPDDVVLSPREAAKISYEYATAFFAVKAEARR